jgi:hypothetical protein
VILFNELIKNRFGLSARWLLASGESGMFYQGSNSNLLWQPRPEFYYAYFTQKFTGDHMIRTSSDNPDILAYASRFKSGETGVILVNKGKTGKVVEVYPGDIGIGDKYYCYSLTGGTENGDFSQYVSVNNVAPTGTLWGPAGDPADLPAQSFTIGNEISVNCPGLSVQFIMLDAGSTLIDTTTVISDTTITDTTIVDTTTTEILEEAKIINLHNYPNPFSQSTTIQFETSSYSRVMLDVFDQTGKKITELANEVLPPGVHSFPFNGNSLSGGVYYYTLKTANLILTRKMILIK